MRNPQTVHTRHHQMQTRQPSVPLCRLSVVVWTVKIALPVAMLLGLLIVVVSL